MRHHHKMSRSGSFLEFVVRQTKRVAIVAVALFLLFVIVMVIIWAAPKVWNWALG
ncbi:hypothetical protein J4437_01350 [Candidatus Woesearchaeota archaeon]|nr:hypothetical protein [Candidatus Woesearchaeota archaeon]